MQVVALSTLHLLHFGVGHSRRVSVGQQTTRLQECVLQQVFPHLVCPLLGAADHFCINTNAPLTGACLLPDAQGAKADRQKEELCSCRMMALT